MNRSILLFLCVIAFVGMNGAAESIGFVKIGPEHAVPWRIPETMTVVVLDSDIKPIPITFPPTLWCESRKRRSTTREVL